MDFTQTEARIRASFAQQSMMQTIGAELVEIEEGRVTITAPVSAHVLQQQGFAHGGMVFSIADSAAGYSALSTLPADSEVMSVEVKINYLAPATGHLEAIGRVIKPGRRLVVVGADVWSTDNGKRRHVAILQGTMIPVGA